MGDWGPDWVWALMGLFAFVGLLGTLAGIVYGIYWLCVHVVVI